MNIITRKRQKETQCDNKKQTYDMITLVLREWVQRFSELCTLWLVLLYKIFTDKTDRPETALEIMSH